MKVSSHTPIHTGILRTLGYKSVGEDSYRKIIKTVDKKEVWVYCFNYGDGLFTFQFFKENHTDTYCGCTVGDLKSFEGWALTVKKETSDLTNI